MVLHEKLDLLSPVKETQRAVNELIVELNEVTISSLQLLSVYEESWSQIFGLKESLLSSSE